ncbi:protein MobC [Desulfovibrio sp. OttesenSCG-928-G15]|nr:protein MobC [Desulfovibrio sp. OttesenSCG-928-G15]
MNITTAQVKEIRLELAKLKPVKVTLDGNRSLTVKEAIRALAPTLERMRKRGFDTQEIAEKLHEKGIEVKPPTLAKYLNEFRRGKDKKKDTASPPTQSEKTTPTPQPDKPVGVSTGQFIITPDMPLDEL